MTLARLSKRMKSQQSGFYPAQIPLLSLLHQRIIRRLWWVRIILLLFHIVVYFKFFSGEAFSAALFNLQIALVFLLLCGWNLTPFWASIMPFLPGDRRLANNILQSRPSDRPLPTLKRRAEWTIYDPFGILISMTLIVISVFFVVATGQHLISLLFLLSGTVLLYMSLQLLARQRQQVNHIDPNDNRYVFLMPFHWRYGYQLVSCLNSEELTPFERIKLEALLCYFFDDLSLWFASRRYYCWTARYNNDQGPDERNLPYTPYTTRINQGIKGDF